MGAVIGSIKSIPMRSRNKNEHAHLVLDFLRASRYGHPESAFGSSPAVKFIVRRDVRAERQERGIKAKCSSCEGSTKVEREVSIIH